MTHIYDTATHDFYPVLDLSAFAAPYSSYTMNYTRKRALLACDFCRHRKRRCDGGQPCSTCRDAQADCRFKELPTDRIEPSSTTPSSQGALVERLSRIEALLEEQGNKLSEALTNPSPASWPSFRSSPRLSAPSPASVSNRSLEGGEFDLDTQFLIPPGHSATLAWLLTLPPIRAIIGDFPKTYFFELEDASALPQPLDITLPAHINWPSLEAHRLQEFADVYFEQVAVHLTLLTQDGFAGLAEDVLQNGPSFNIETAICLSVWALGCIASKPGITATSGSSTDTAQELSLEYFSIALRIILSKAMWGFTSNLQTCQALILAGMYFGYLGRPLHAWKMTHSAGQKLLEQFDMQLQTGGIDYTDEDRVRIFWACFIRDCDSAGEFDVRKSGIEPFGDQMRLPRSFDASESENLIYWTAEVAILRLINRIIGNLYSPDNIDITLIAESGTTSNNNSLNQLVTLSSELDRQLEEYYNTIPVRPPLSVDPVSNDQRRRLNARALYARHLIHRPFVLYIALQPTHQPSVSTRASSAKSPLHLPYPTMRVIMEKCKVCIQSSEGYIQNAVTLLDKPSPHLWSVAQASVACFVVLLLASRSPHLRPLVTDVDILASMLLPSLKKRASAGSLFGALVKIVEGLLANPLR